MEDIHAAKVQNDPHSAEPLVALYRGTSWVSRAVQFQTRSVYSHAGLRLPDGSIIESCHRGGVKRNAHLGAVHTPGTVVDLFRVTVPVDWDAALMFAAEQIGKPYDFRGVARFITRRTPDCNPPRWFCSALIQSAIEHGGVKLLERICPSAVAPGHQAMSPLLEFIRTEFTSAEPLSTTTTRAAKAGENPAAITEPPLAAVPAPSCTAARLSGGMMQGTPLDSWSGFIADGLIFAMAAAIGVALLVGCRVQFQVSSVPATTPAPEFVAPLAAPASFVPRADCRHCGGSGLISWSNLDYITFEWSTRMIPCFVCDGTIAAPPPAPESASLPITRDPVPAFRFAPALR